MRYPLNKGQTEVFLAFIKSNSIKIKVTSRTRIIKVPIGVWKKYEEEIVDIVYNPKIMGKMWAEGQNPKKAKVKAILVEK